MTVRTKIGSGPKVSGKIAVVGSLDKPAGTGEVDFSLAGKIVVCPTHVSRELLEKMSVVKAAGMVAASVHWRDYEGVRDAEDPSLLVLLRFGSLNVSSELEKKLAKLDGKMGTLDGNAKELTTE